MEKTIKKHEEINLHIKKYGTLMGLIKLPFNLLFCIIAFPFMFWLDYIGWYNGEVSPKYSCFFYYFYGWFKEEYELKKRR
jgi:hypothetical protein